MVPKGAARFSDLSYGTLGLALVAVGWTLVNRSYGALVLPSLADTGAALLRIVLSSDALAAVTATVGHAFGGVAIGAAAGLILGLIGGVVRPVGAALAPVATAILAVPPIVWVVLAFLWFGTTGTGILFTVAISSMPILFAATLQGVRSRNRHLAEMATVFRLPLSTRLLRILLPDLAVMLSPALATAFAISWKVALTSEVLGDGSGIGGRFAVARAHLDLPEAMAWIILVVGVVLSSDALLLGPLRRWLSRSRTAMPSRLIDQPPKCASVNAVTDRAC
uniref:Binding-protein-dependent transport systems inner membrane component n=1 Tax=Rhodopseudomonas palustris (strain BisA53) TaxID=316055 RepID=Q07JR8_RHOP5